MELRLNRRTALVAGLASAAGAVLGRAAESARFTLTSGPFVEVETALGRVRGGHSRGAVAFKGIPYAGSVSGAARFKEAPPPAPWSGVRDALRLGPPSIQGPGTVYGEDEPPYSEDCLVLNVWTPAADGGKRPVMFYCHGGGYTTGSAGARGQDGARLAATYDVVVVACNHRLGLLGYLYLGDLGGEEYAASGNQGMLDIVAALRWVNRNIEVFGGDSANVMVFGESGGGFKTGTLLAMPSAHGLFHKASIESGAALRRMPKDVATETALRVLHGLGLERQDLHKLAGVPADVFVKMQADAQRGEGPLATPSDPSVPSPPRTGLLQRAGDTFEPGSWGPVVDGTFLPVHPFDPAAPAISADIPVIVGNNRDEATFFNMARPATFSMDEAAFAARMRTEFGRDADRIASVYRRARPKASPTELYIAIASAQWFGNDATELAERKSRQPAAVFRYRYDYQSNFLIPGTSYPFGAGHASEIAMKFYNCDMPGLHGNGAGVTAASRNMSTLWTSFARTGRPAAPGQPAWTPYDTDRRATMLIDTQCRLVDDPDADERRLWEDLQRA